MKIKHEKIFQRDRWLCAFCGVVRTDGALVVHHRGNRGMGGNKHANSTSNLLSLCGLCNGVIESDADAARQARRWGIKIPTYFASGAHIMPVKMPVPGMQLRVWMSLDNHYGTAIAGDEHQQWIEWMEHDHGVV